MSGICAIWRKDDPRELRAALETLAAGMSLAPTDRRTEEFDAGAGVAVQAAFPQQQVYRNARILVACDADLLNETDLRSATGTTPAAPGPAALVADLYERYGEGFAEHLRGAFAIVVWDITERRLVAAIDGFGIKRLVWYADNHQVVVASRVDALRGAVGRLAINPRAIINVVNFSTNLGPETAFTGIRRLLPGTLLLASEGDTRTVAYWKMQYGAAGATRVNDLSRELETVMQESVAQHFGADGRSGEAGAFLSGGTDSSTVVGLMTRASGGPVKAFSIGFQEPGYNELGYAELAARSFGAEHYTYLVGAADCLNALPAMVRSFDEPFCNSSALPTYFCARLASEHGVTTLLAGDGGDELFGGNERYSTDKIFQLYHDVPSWLRSGLIEPFAEALPTWTTLGRRARGYLRRAKMAGVERMLSYQFLRTHALEDVFDGDFLQSLGQYSILDIPSAHYAEASASDHLDRLLFVDLKITLADNDLPKVTYMSEMAGVRARFPFLDRSVAEFSGRVPARLKVKGFKKRFLFKRAVRNLLPPEIIRKKKHGFGLPIALWMKTDPGLRELARDTLLSERASSRGYFRRGFVEEWFRKHDATDSADYGEALWTFLALELWHRQVVDQPAGLVT